MLNELRLFRGLVLVLLAVIFTSIAMIFQSSQFSTQLGLFLDRYLWRLSYEYYRVSDREQEMLQANSIDVQVKTFQKIVQRWEANHQFLERVSSARVKRGFDYSLRLHAESERRYVNLLLFDDTTYSPVVIRSGQPLKSFYMNRLPPPMDRIVPARDGGYFVRLYNFYLAKVNASGAVEWIRFINSHHSFEESESGSINVLANTLAAKFDERLGQFSFLEDYLVTLSSKGEVISQFSIYEAFKHLVAPEDVDKLGSNVPHGLSRVDIVNKAGPFSIFDPSFQLIAYLARPVAGARIDYFMHTNEVTELKRTIPGVGEKGDLVFSFASLSRIGVYSKSQRRAVWSSPAFKRMHSVVALESGRFLFFENSYQEDQSRIVEWDPVQNRVTWQYSEKGFFSDWGGQVFADGDDRVVIVDRSHDRIFSVNRKGEVLWEMMVPNQGESKSSIPLAGSLLSQKWLNALDHSVISRR